MLSCVGAGLEQLMHRKFTPFLLPATNFPVQASLRKKNHRLLRFFFVVVLLVFFFMFLSQFHGCFTS